MNGEAMSDDEFRQAAQAFRGAAEAEILRMFDGVETSGHDASNPGYLGRVVALHNEYNARFGDRLGDPW